MDAPPGEMERPEGGTGRDYQASLDRDHRHRTGVFYTPTTLASGLTRAAFAGLAVATGSRVCDPSCGGGAFLLAAAALLEVRSGLTRTEIASTRLWGADVDPDAVNVARDEILRWVAEREPAPAEDVAELVARHIVVGDSLLIGSAVWPEERPSFDLILGNPPFQGQLGRTTTRAPEYTATVCDRLAVSVAPYTDTAALFLLSGLDLVRPGGRVLLIQPQSVLSTRDAAPVRTEVLARGRLVGMWADDTLHFDAAVQVCAPIVDRAADDRSMPNAGADAAGAPVAEDAVADVRRWAGPAVRDAGLVAGSNASLRKTWSPLLADVRGVPPLDLVARVSGGEPEAGLATLGDLAVVTAGFRQHFYGLIPFVGESQAEAPTDEAPTDEMRLLTSGLIDPANERWGRTSTRFGGQRFLRPVVDVVALAGADAEVARWGRSLAVPKLLVATQTRVVEVIADRNGSRWPSVPVIAVGAVAEDLSRLAAVLLSPAVSAWAMTHFAGAALSADAIKLSATQVRSIPLPRCDRDAWDAAARSFEQAEQCAQLGDGDGWSSHLDALGQQMGQAYGVGDAVFAWWQARRPGYRS